MFQRKTVATVVSIYIVIFLLLYHYNYRYTIDIYNEEMSEKPIYLNPGLDDFLVNTKGCVIPNFAKNLKFQPGTKCNLSCGVRAVFVKKISSNLIEFHIDSDKIRKYMRNDNYECRYKFASRSTITGDEDIEIIYRPSRIFKNGTIIDLLEEVITVKCISLTPSKHIYEDAYMRVKKTKTNIQRAKEKWNVLVLGLDTMSRARVLSEMPKLTKYIRKHSWLDFKGYTKIGQNTYPNLIALITGQISSIFKTCKPSVSTCNEQMIWSTYRRAGYMTAYGEDFLRCPDTFSAYNGFQFQPTHHYMRPLFLVGEKNIGNIVCTKHLTTVKHIVDYAFDFATTYKNDSFFGIFWINSIGHNSQNMPSLHENDIISLLESMTKAGSLKNTFIILLSDHGNRFGPNRLPMESYYAERMPMLFIYVPKDFQKLHREEYLNLRLNQNRLISTYDLYKTLVKISNMTVISRDTTSGGCSTCINLFEESPSHRTCADAGINEKWCTCHNMQYIDSNTNEDGKISIQFAVSYIQDKAMKVKTVNNCWKCQELKLNQVIRTHSYTYLNKTFFVVAISMKPGDMKFEAIVVKNNKSFSMHDVSLITTYKNYGCVVKSADKMWCNCKEAKCYLFKKLLRFLVIPSIKNKLTDLQNHSQILFPNVT